MLVSWEVFIRNNPDDNDPLDHSVLEWTASTNRIVLESNQGRIKVNEAEASSVLQYQLEQDPLPSLSVTHVLVLSICCLIAIAERIIPTLIVNKLIQLLLLVDCDGILVRIFHKVFGRTKPSIFFHSVIANPLLREKMDQCYYYR